MRKFIALLVVFLAAAVVVSLPCPALAAGWKTGTAKEKVTPQDPLWMAGYAARTHPASGVLNDLWAKALVLEDERGVRAAIISLDLIGIGPDVARPICAELEAKHRLPRANVVIFCSHTHSGPVVGRAARTMHYDQVDDAQRQLIDRYAASLRQSVVEMVARAIDGLRESQLSWGTGKASFAVNRRNNKEAEAPRLREAGQLLGPIDHDVPVLAIRDSSGALTAVLYGYACHATVLGDYEWSSDYPGFAQSELEAEHTGCTALFFAGCGGDQNPLPRRKVDYARQYGRDLAKAVDDVLKGPMEPLTATLQTAYVEVPLELAKIPTRDELEKDAQSTDRFISVRARVCLDRLRSGESIPSTYPYPIQACASVRN